MILDEIIADSEGANKHHKLWVDYQKKKTELINQKASKCCGTGADKLQWTVRNDVKKSHDNTTQEYHDILGIKGFNFNKKNVKANGKNDRINFLNLLKHLWPGDWKDNLAKMNQYIKKHNNNRKSQMHKKVHMVSQNEFWKFFGLMLVARLEGIPGGDLWKNNGLTEGYRNLPNIGRMHMTQFRFKEIKRFVSYMWADEGRKESDPWW